MLDKLVKRLSEIDYNRCSFDELGDFDILEIKKLCKNEIKNKGLIKLGKHLGGDCYYGVELTEKGKEYCTNGFKFKEENNNPTINIIDSDIKGSNIAGTSNGNQSIEINTKIDEIIKLLDKNNIEQKEEIKKILEEYKENGDKKYLEKLGNLSSVGSFIIGILGLL